MLQILEQKGFIERRATGSSMMPFIRSGDTLIISKLNGKLKKGDIALFEQDGKYLLHRVVKVYINGYKCRGDNRYKADAFVPREKVFGKLDAIYKKDKIVECNSKKFKLLSKLYNFVLFRYFNVFCMRAISRKRHKKDNK